MSKPVRVQIKSSVNGLLMVPGVSSVGAGVCSGVGKAPRNCPGFSSAGVVCQEAGPALIATKVVIYKMCFLCSLKKA